MSKITINLGLIPVSVGIVGSLMVGLAAFMNPESSIGKVFKAGLMIVGIHLIAGVWKF